MIDVSVYRQVKNVRFPSRSVEKIAAYVCRHEKVKKAVFSFVLVDDRSIRRIHKKYFKKDTVTDIITFPLESGSVDAEIYINVRQARRQSKDFGVSFHNELVRLVVHGVLHTLGYDDRSPALRSKMFTVQERYVAELSL